MMQSFETHLLVEGKEVSIRRVKLSRCGGMLAMLGAGGTGVTLYVSR